MASWKERALASFGSDRARTDKTLDASKLRGEGCTIDRRCRFLGSFVRSRPRPQDHCSTLITVSSERKPACKPTKAGGDILQARG